MISLSPTDDRRHSQEIMIIEAAKNWIALNLQSLEDHNLVVETSGPTEQQTKKSFVISVKSNRFDALICCFETGECDAIIADLSSTGVNIDDGIESNYT